MNPKREDDMPETMEAPPKRRGRKPGFHPRPRDDEIHRKIVGCRIRDVRVAAGLSGGELARRIGTHKAVISTYECGRSWPNAIMAVRIAAALGTTVEALYGPPEKSNASDLTRG